MPTLSFWSPWLKIKVAVTVKSLKVLLAGKGSGRIWFWLFSTRTSALLVMLREKPLSLPVAQPLLLLAKVSENNACCVGTRLGDTVGVDVPLVVAPLGLVKKKSPPPTSMMSKTMMPMIKPTFGPFFG